MTNQNTRGYLRPGDVIQSNPAKRKSFVWFCSLVNMMKKNTSKANKCKQQLFLEAQVPDGALSRPVSPLDVLLTDIHFDSDSLDEGCASGPQNSLARANNVRLSTSFTGSLEGTRLESCSAMTQDPKQMADRVGAPRKRHANDRMVFTWTCSATATA